MKTSLLSPHAPRSQRKAKAARSRRLNTWMPGLQAAMAGQKRRGLFNHAQGIMGLHHV